MENLTEILTDLEKGKITTDYAEEKVLRLFGVSGQLPLGEDMDGNQIFPHDTVLREGDENLPVKIEYGKYRERFDFGYIVGWYVPDYCKKIER
jgi:hypothetical protein